MGNTGLPYTETSVENPKCEFRNVDADGPCAIVS